MTAAVKFTRKTLPQKEGLGEKLAKKRISLGLDIRDVEKAIRIRAKHIDAIESGNYTGLPPDVYVRGFISNYSTFLGLDPDKVIRLYERERGLEESAKNIKNKPSGKVLNTPKLVITPKTITIFLITLFFLLIFSYIGWQVNILTSPPILSISGPADDFTTSDNSVVVAGETSPGSTLLINEVEVGIGQNGSFKEKVNLQTGVNIIKVKALNKLGRTNQVDRTVVSQYIGAATPAPGAFEVKVTIGPRSASLQVETDNKKVTEKPIIMLAGVSQTYKANETIKITTNDGGSVQATYNDQSVGFLGKANENTTREFVKGMTIK